MLLLLTAEEVLLLKTGLAAARPEKAARAMMEACMLVAEIVRYANDMAEDVALESNESGGRCER
jgi:hypothetical protein